MTGIAAGTPPAPEACEALIDATAALAARGAAEPNAMLMTKVAAALIFRNIVHLRRFSSFRALGGPAVKSAYWTHLRFRGERATALDVTETCHPPYLQAFAAGCS